MGSRGCTGSDPPVIIHFGEESDNVEEVASELDMSTEDECGFCLLCGGEEQKGRWLGQDFCAK